MKKRPNGFLSPEHIDQDGEIFNYIQELHEYLWRFVCSEMPGASGVLDDHVDKAIGFAEERSKEEERIDLHLKELDDAGIRYPSGD